MWGKHIYKGVLDLLFPRACQVCGVIICSNCKNLICKDCMGDLKRVEEPLCAICGMEIFSTTLADHICGDCLIQTPPFEYARSLFRYDDGVRSLISRLKYQKDISVLQSIRQLIKSCDLSLYNSCDLVVPVPLHKKRVQERTFNQSLLLARACFGEKDKRINGFILQRTVNTVPQVSLGANARRNSLKNAFKVPSEITLSGKTICLIDDVYTTGTTVSECSRALLKAGAARVYVLTFARADVPRRGRK